MNLTVLPVTRVAAPSSQGHTLTKAAPVEQGRDAADEAGTNLRHSAGEASPRCPHAACLVELLYVPCGPRSQRQRLLHRGKSTI